MPPLPLQDSLLLLHRYLLLTVASGCEPVNRLFVLDLANVGTKADGGLDFTAYDKQKVSWLKYHDR